MSAVPLKAGDPAGLLLAYRGLSAARNTGRYTSSFIPPYGGEYLAIAQIDQPKLVHCEKVHLQGPPDPLQNSGKTAAAALVSLDVSSSVGSGSRELRFTLASTDGTKLQPRRLLLMGADGSWHERSQQFRPQGKAFAAELLVGPAGPARLFVEYREPTGELRTVATTLTIKPKEPAR
jgi:hypothetical protein